MKHWAFAFIVIVGLAWLHQDDVPGGLFDDPVKKRRAAQYELESSKIRLHINDESRDLLIELETLEVLADNPAIARLEAQDLASETLAWNREELALDVESARRRLNRLR